MKTNVVSDSCLQKGTALDQGAWITRESQVKAPGKKRTDVNPFQRLIPDGWWSAVAERGGQGRISMKAKPAWVIGLCLLTLAAFILFTQMDAVSNAAQRKMAALKSLPAKFYAGPKKSPR
jgi:hypothetical protein